MKPPSTILHVLQGEGGVCLNPADNGPFCLLWAVSMPMSQALFEPGKILHTLLSTSSFSMYSENGKIAQVSLYHSSEFRVFRK